MVLLVSSRVLEYHNGSNRPKFIQNQYSNGRIDLIHNLKNGTSVKTTIKKPKPTFFQRVKSYLAHHSFYHIQLTKFKPNL